ncbi:hypothetical protein BC940DRAFT_362255 [Gongronella butleri]|nr:hypothetical protein BC940DRAFT_362255 [Gongronella butleri]
MCSNTHEVADALLGLSHFVLPDAGGRFNGINQEIDNSSSSFASSARSVPSLPPIAMLLASLEQEDPTAMPSSPIPCMDPAPPMASSGPSMLLASSSSSSGLSQTTTVRGENKLTASIMYSDAPSRPPPSPLRTQSPTTPPIPSSSSSSLGTMPMSSSSEHHHHHQQAWPHRVNARRHASGSLSLPAKSKRRRTSLPGPSSIRKMAPNPLRRRRRASATAQKQETMASASPSSPTAASLSSYDDASTPPSPASSSTTSSSPNIGPKPRWKDAERIDLFRAIVKEKRLDDMTSIAWDRIAAAVGRAKKACKDQWRREVLPTLLNNMK